ncbi:N/A [soil metagenome]
MISKKKLNNLLGRFGVELHGTGYLQALTKGDFNQDHFQVQKNIIKKKNPIIFDIGANTGSITAKYLEYFPAAHIYAFEPFPNSFEHLVNRHKSNANITCIEKAVASTNGSREFFVNKNVDTNSLLRPQKTGLSSDEQVSNISTIKVDTIVLDEFCRTANIPYIDILKMDIQGGEFDALQGLKEMLQNNGIGIIYSEVYFVEQYEGQPLYHDIAKLLVSFGYYVQDIYNPIYGKGSLAWADVIFTKRALDW